MNESVLTERTVETELAAFQSLSGIKAAYVGEQPSRRTLDAIHDGAVRMAARRRFARRVFAVAKVASVLCLLSGAAWYLTGAGEQPEGSADSGVGDATAPTLTVNAGSLSEEELLLDIQGMDDESFFASQEDAFLL